MKSAGTFFAIILLCMVSTLHLVRLILGVEVIIGGWSAPQWISVGGCAVPAIIAVMLWREGKST